jgi:hypothetical protein
MKLFLYSTGAAGLAFVLTVAGDLAACPFCNVESKTLSEETKGADAVVLAKLVKEAPTTTDSNDPNSGMATFQIVEALSGQDALGDTKEISVVFFGDSDREKTYLVTGLGKDKIDWTTPLPLTPAAIEYIRKLPTVAPAGGDRLEFFQDYLEHEDPLLAQDAYDEFGKAPYAEVQELKSRMKHDKLLEWVADPEVSPSRRRLYLTMLGVCGTKDDVPLLESMIVSDFEAMKPALESIVAAGVTMGGPVGLPVIIEAVQQDERRKKLGLDALVACYLILKGPDGLDLIENRFLKNPHAEYTHIYSTIMALRFHGDENTGILPRERLLGSMRLLLKNPEFADQVILDLSRWEDWSVLDQLVEMFKTSDEKGYVRQPVVSYLTVASEQTGDVGSRAKVAMAELEKLDPETVKTARNLMAFGALGRARGAASAASATAKSEDAKAAAEAAVSADDSSQGFKASPEDEKTDVSQIPDPATFVKEGQGGKNVDAAAKDNAKAAPEAPAVVPAESSSQASPLLVAGVPLVAAGLLMGIYWMILRAGAV